MVMANKETDDTNDLVESKVTAKEEPLPEFTAAISDLRTVYCSIMEEDPSWKEGLMIDKISIRRTKQGTRSVILSGTKQLECRVDFLHPVCAPCVQIDPATDGESGAVTIPAPLADAIKKAIHEAERYMKGERSQTVLDFKEASDGINALAKKGKDKDQRQLAGV